MNFDRDPVVEEVRKVRSEIMKEFSYNPHALGRFLAQREESRRLKSAKMPRRIKKLSLAVKH
jgi:hypothetical protein